MQSDNYILIQGWMCSELNLKGNALLIFALIHGFSQDGQSRFYGSRNYIADTLNISLPTVDKAIEELRDKNLITRYVITDENGVHYEYETCKETLQGVVKKLYGGSKETLHNNTSKKTNNKKVVSKDTTTEFSFGKQKPQKDNLYTKCVSLVNDYTTDEELHKTLIDYLRVRLEIKDKPLYTNSWKGLLNKLDRDFDANERLAVVRQSIERGYLSFYPVSNYSGVKSESGSRHVPRMTEEDYKKEAEHLAELEARGERVRF